MAHGSNKIPATRKGTAGCRGTTLVRHCLATTASSSTEDGIFDTSALVTAADAGSAYSRAGRFRQATRGPCSADRGDATFQPRGSLQSPFRPRTLPVAISVWTLVQHSRGTRFCQIEPAIDRCVIVGDLSAHSSRMSGRNEDTRKVRLWDTTWHSSFTSAAC
jgi:hypothetical protein